MNNEQRKWSRDGAKMDWKNIKEKLESIDVFPKDERVQADIGITADEFAEYLDWLAENEPEEYWESIFYLKLRELGVPIEIVEYWVQHPEDFTKEIKKWSEDGGVG